MAPLSTDEMVLVRRQVGTKPTDAEVQVIYDRTGSIENTVLEILEIRLSEMKRKPLSFAIAGEYRETRSAEQIEALEEQIAGLGGGTSSLGLVTITEADYRHRR